MFWNRLILNVLPSIVLYAFSEFFKTKRFKWFYSAFSHHLEYVDSEQICWSKIDYNESVPYVVAKEIIILLWMYENKIFIGDTLNVFR